MNNNILPTRPVSLQEINALRSLLKTEGPAAVYTVLAARGYLYAGLALGVAQDNTISGAEAIGFLRATLQTQGRVSSPSLEVTLKRSLCDAYLNVLVKYGNPTGIASMDINATDAWAIHKDVFLGLGIPADAWTMNTPFSLMQHEAARENLWEILLSTSSYGGAVGNATAATVLATYPLVAVGSSPEWAYESWLVRIMTAVPHVMSAVASGILVTEGTPETLYVASASCIVANAEKSLVFSLGGNNLIQLGAGTAKVYGAAGDSIHAGSGYAVINAGDFSTVVGDAGQMNVTAGKGVKIEGGEGYAYIRAATGDEISSDSGHGSISFSGKALTGGRWLAVKGYYLGDNGVVYQPNQDGTVTVYASASDATNSSADFLVLHVPLHQEAGKQAPTAESWLGMQFSSELVDFNAKYYTPRIVATYLFTQYQTGWHNVYNTDANGNPIYVSQEPVYAWGPQSAGYSVSNWEYAPNAEDIVLSNLSRGSATIKIVPPSNPNDYGAENVIMLVMADGSQHRLGGYSGAHPTTPRYIIWQDGTLTKLDGSLVTYPEAPLSPALPATHPVLSSGEQSSGSGGTAGNTNDIGHSVSAVQLVPTAAVGVQVLQEFANGGQLVRETTLVNVASIEGPMKLSAFQVGAAIQLVLPTDKTVADVHYVRLVTGDLLLRISEHTLLLQGYYLNEWSPEVLVVPEGATRESLSTVLSSLMPQVGANDGELTLTSSVASLLLSADVTSSHLVIAQDLLGQITLTVQGGSTVLKFPAGQNVAALPTLHFSDGAQWSPEQVVSHVSVGVTDATADFAEILTYRAGSGACVVSQAKAAGSAQNSLVFGSGITPADVHLQQIGTDLVVKVGSSGDQITVSGYFANGSQSQFASFKFSDGSQWSVDAVAEADNSFATGKGPQVAILSSVSPSHIVVDDMLSPSALRVSVDPSGNLRLSAVGTTDSLTLTNWSNANAAHTAVVQFADGVSWDYGKLMQQLSLSMTDYSAPDAQTVLVNFGDGVRTVTQNKPWGAEQNTLTFGPGVNFSDVAFFNSGNDLVLHLRTGDQLTIPSYFSNWNSADQFAVIQFADGTTIAGNQMPTVVDSADPAWNQWGYPYINLGNGSTAAPTTVEATKQNTYVWGGQGNVTVHSTADNVSLAAGAGTNIFNLGANQHGNNFYDWRNGAGEHNWVQFDSTVQVSDVQVKVQPWGSLVLTNMLTGGSLTLQNFLQSNFPLDGVKFADGTVQTLYDIKSGFVSAPGETGTLQLADGQYYWGGNTAGTIIGGAAWGTVIKGSTAGDTLLGGAGFSGLFATSGDNLLELGTGGGYLYGGTGTDLLLGHTGVYAYIQGKQGVSQLLYGGAPSDNLNGQGVLAAAGDQAWVNVSGKSVVLFDKNDGNQTVYGLGQWSMQSTDSTISVGGGIEDADISLSRDGQNLVLHLGTSDSITLGGWYPGDPQHPGMTPHINLQVVEEAAANFDVTSADPMKAHKLQEFDFNAFAAAFDAAQAADPSVTSLHLTDSIAQFLVGTSDTAAYGGDLAYYYAMHGSFDGMSSEAARSVLKDADFGQQQDLHSLQNLKQGTQLLSTGHHPELLVSAELIGVSTFT